MPHVAMLMLFSTLLVFTGGCAHNPKAMSQPNAKYYALRLKPHQDLRLEIEKFVKEKNLKAAAVVTCVGSLEEVNLRYANQREGTQTLTKHEITSLVGTLSVNGSHLHVQAADGAGRSIGGHLLEGNKIYTTAEIVLVEITDLEFLREVDSETTYKELVIQQKI